MREPHVSGRCLCGARSDPRDVGERPGASARADGTVKGLRAEASVAAPIGTAGSVFFVACDSTPLLFACTLAGGCVPARRRMDASQPYGACGRARSMRR